jgi:hypothetical protein
LLRTCERQLLESPVCPKRHLPAYGRGSSRCEIWIWSMSVWGQKRCLVQWMAAPRLPPCTVSDQTHAGIHPSQATLSRYDEKTQNSGTISPWKQRLGWCVAPAVNVLEMMLGNTDRKIRYLRTGLASARLAVPNAFPTRPAERSRHAYSIVQGDSSLLAGVARGRPSGRCRRRRLGRQDRVRSGRGARRPGGRARTRHEDRYRGRLRGGEQGRRRQGPQARAQERGRWLRAD